MANPANFSDPSGLVTLAELKELTEQLGDQALRAHLSTRRNVLGSDYYAEGELAAMSRDALRQELHGAALTGRLSVPSLHTTSNGAYDARDAYRDLWSQVGEASKDLWANGPGNARSARDEAELGAHGEVNRHDQGVAAGEAAADVQTAVVRRSVESSVAGAAIGSILSALAKAKAYVVYTVRDARDRIVYVGRASGRGAPEQVLRSRRSSHQLRDSGAFVIEDVQKSRSANRGGEQVIYDRERLRAEGEGRALLNKNAPISNRNPRGREYVSAWVEEGKVQER